ncbi:hypothetical protein, partial [Paraliomyxa miuraensis]|uniref:hypothetical protein n=1 Tax=Paraliomyxa miuraensis TaxID=376150 RepID=UPI00224FC707
MDRKSIWELKFAISAYSSHFECLLLLACAALRELAAAVYEVALTRLAGAPDLWCTARPVSDHRTL